MWHALRPRDTPPVELGRAGDASPDAAVEPSASARPISEAHLRPRRAAEASGGGAAARWWWRRVVVEGSNRPASLPKTTTSAFLRAQGGGGGGAQRWGAVARPRGVARAAAASGQRGRTGDGRLYPPRRTSSRSGRTACRRTWARASTPCLPGASALGARGGRAACGELRGKADRCAGASVAGPRRCTPRGRRGGASRAAETPSQREQRRPTSPRYPPPRWRTSRPSSGTRAYRRNYAPQGRAVQPARTPASWAPGSAVRLAASARRAVQRRTGGVRRRRHA
jgi:hypothetical protein